MKDTIESVIERQRLFFETGKTRSLSFRIKQLEQLKKQLASYEVELLEALEKDLGKPSTEGFMTELGLIYRHLDEMIKKLPKWGRRQRVKTPLFLWPAQSYFVPTPYGNTLIFSPFNYPVLLTLDPLIGAIAGGNTTLVGMSEHTPNTNYILKTLIQDIYLSDYVYFFTSSIDVNQFVLNQKFDKIFFTGSEKVGKIVLQKAAEQLTPTTLELGGKSPVIVTENADIELAAQRIIWGKFINAGQTCVAPDYCLVAEPIKDDLLEQMCEVLVRFFGEHPELSTDYGRMIHQDAVRRMSNLIHQDQDYLFMGGKYDESKKYVSPTILFGTIKDELVSMSEEIFGPILPILSFEHIDQAIDFVNNQPKPLAFYPFSSDGKEVDLLVDKIDAGGITINDTLLHLSNESLPFGGVGSSGMGHYHGKASLECFSYPKSILRRGTIINLPVMFPPYTKEKGNLIRSFFK